MKKRALLVAINYVGTRNELRGCINDSTHMFDYLTNKGFTEIKRVLETDATTANIKNGLAWLTEGVAPGDVIVFHYSGHGSQLPSSFESDGYEEIICPIDLDWMNRVVSDADLKKIFNKVPNGVNTTLILDCCHSGTMLNQNNTMAATKEVNGPEATNVKPKRSKDDRYLAPPAAIIKKLKTRKLVEWQASRDVNRSALLIAGCAEDQTSADAIIDKIPQGAATAALLRTVAADPSISYRDLVNSMVAFMKKYKLTQVPQLDGSPALYDLPFIEPFTITITDDEDIIDTPPVIPVSSSSPSGIAGIISAIIKFITSFFKK